MLNHKTRLNEIQLDDRLILLESIEDIDALFDELIHRGPAHEDVKDEKIPYWAEVWPSSIAMANYLLNRKIITPGMKVLEIGCGTGLSGVVAGQLGASVIFSDYLEEALFIAEKNWKLNNTGSASFIRMDWRKPLMNLHPELILASDIAYEKRSFIDLLNMFRFFLKPGVKFIVTEPNRAVAQSFFSELTNEGILVTTSMQAVVFKEHSSTVFIHELSCGE